MNHFLLLEVRIDSAQDSDCGSGFGVTLSLAALHRPSSAPSERSSRGRARAFQREANVMLPVNMPIEKHVVGIKITSGLIRASRRRVRPAPGAPGAYEWWYFDATATTGARRGGDLPRRLRLLAALQPRGGAEPPAWTWPRPAQGAFPAVSVCCTATALTISAPITTRARRFFGPPRSDSCRIGRSAFRLSNSAGARLRHNARRTFRGGRRLGAALSGK